MAEAENGQEKTEDATDERKRKAREEGQLVRSRELVSVALVASGGIGLLLLAPMASSRLLALTQRLFTQAGQIDVAPQSLLASVGSEAVATLSWVLVPFLLLTVVCGIGASVAVGGLTLTAKALRPKFERLNPIKGLGRMFSAKSFVELFKSILKFLLISAIALTILYVSVDSLMSLVFFDVAMSIGSGVSVVAWSLLAYAAALLLIAVIDVPFQVAQHKKQLKMTQQEVKEELKNSEGRPEVKARIRRLQQELSNRQMLGDVPEASVVLTNPEHYSVALRYDSEQGVPVICALGIDHMALRIREVAKAHGVEILRVPPLARAIYHNGHLGDEIPYALYAPVAQVLAYVAQLNEYRAGRTRTVPTLAPIQLPKDLADGSSTKGRVRRDA